MQIKTLQWNIGGGRIRNKDADATNPSNYSEENLHYIAAVLQREQPDIVTLQETHVSDDFSQAKVLAEKTAMPYYFDDSYDESHIDTSKRLSQSVLSKFPIHNHSFSFFLNPGWKQTSEDGKIYHSHNKGISTCRLFISPERELTLQTLHAVPFRIFAVEAESPEAAEVIQSMEKEILTNSGSLLVQGDFNIDANSLSKVFPKIFSKGISNIPLEMPTTPKGRKYDHVLFSGLTFSEQHIDNTALTDHYPIITTFEF